MDRTRFATRSGAGARRGAKVATTTPSRRRNLRGCGAAAAGAAAAGARSRISTGTAGPSPGDAGAEAGTDASRRGRTRAASRASGRPGRGARSHFVIHRLASHHLARFSKGSRVCHNGARDLPLRRDRVGLSIFTESAETRCAHRRHRLGRHTRNPASASHGRLRLGVDLFGRAVAGSS